MTVINLFAEPTFEGKALLALPQSGSVRTRTANEISMNYSFLLPLVKAYPTKVPEVVVRGSGLFQGWAKVVFLH